MLFAIQQRHRQQRFHFQRVCPLPDSGQLGRVLDIGEDYRALAHRQGLQCANQFDDGHHVALLYAGRAILQRRRGWLARSAQASNASAGIPVPAHIVDRSEQNRLHIGLTVDIPGDLSDPGNVIHRVLVGHCLRHRGSGGRGSGNRRGDNRSAGRRRYRRLSCDRSCRLGCRWRRRSTGIFRRDSRAHVK